jgi:hypothetical protein
MRLDDRRRQALRAEQPVVRHAVDRLEPDFLERRDVRQHSQPLGRRDDDRDQRPSRMKGSAEGMLSKMIGTWPATTSASAGPAPR